MPDHPSWPAELVEKAKVAAHELNRSASEQPTPDEFARAVLSALSGDLVPREQAIMPAAPNTVALPPVDVLDLYDGEATANEPAEKLSPATVDASSVASDESDPRVDAALTEHRRWSYRSTTDAYPAMQAALDAAAAAQWPPEHDCATGKGPVGCCANCGDLSLIPRSQADALAEALEKAKQIAEREIARQKRGIRLPKTTLLLVVREADRALASYRKTTSGASGETEGEG